MWWLHAKYSTGRKHFGTPSQISSSSSRSRHHRGLCPNLLKHSLPFQTGLSTQRGIFHARLPTDSLQTSSEIAVVCVRELNLGWVVGAWLQLRQCFMGCRHQMETRHSGVFSRDHFVSFSWDSFISPCHSPCQTICIYKDWARCLPETEIAHIFWLHAKYFLDYYLLVMTQILGLQTERIMSLNQSLWSITWLM